jgi:UDPglucose 6-dehydrogenase
MKITVIGTGYVGLVTGACFAEMGNHVTCVDVDAQKIARLNQGHVPIYEPGLEAIIKSAVSEQRLSFTTDLPNALLQSKVYFIAVGTPPGEDGSADLRYVLAVARSIGEHLQHHAVIVDKSTVPVGTAEQVKAAITDALQQRGSQLTFDVVSNPEFLKEGDAVHDFMTPDRIIIGADSEHAREVMAELYAPFGRSRDKILTMGVRDAEMTKYVANAMLATKISFMNEVAAICEQLQVDVEQVRRGIGADKRIGPAFIYPGCGYGGSCFPKDVKALIHSAELAHVDPLILKSVEARNQQQKQVLFAKLNQHFKNDLKNKTIAVWGLAFKPGTDDVREAPALILIEALVAAGAKVQAFDPVALETAAAALPEKYLGKQIQLMEDAYQVLIGADALVLVTEWKQFRQPDFDRIKQSLKNPVIIDGRNQYEPAHLKAEGFIYYGIGR